ncbi:MAG: carboxypeptidase-like regulatory domain-containing protein [Bacteroidales bacterium]
MVRVSSRGIVKDAATGEVMPGATIIVKGTSNGVMADMEGAFRISVAPGTYQLECSFVAYDAVLKPVTVVAGETLTLNFDIAEALFGIDDVVVVAKANRENENVLLLERKDATLGIESIGARELSRKGASDVKDGVTKMAGITSMGAMQIFVRGLGDRYNNATLNGMPIPSGNPTAKVIDLDIIPSKIVQKIDVNKVFSASSYADFCGATIDISTRELVSENFLTIDAGTSYNTISYNNQMKFEDGFKGFKSYFGFNNERYKLPSEIGPIGDPNNDLSAILYDPFYTDFSFTSGKMLPALSLGISGGKKIILGSGDLNILFAGGFKNGFDYSYGSKLLHEAGGGIIYDFDFKKWTYKANTTGLLNINYQLNRDNQIALTALMINNTNNTIEENFGYHSTNDGLIKARRYEYDNNRVLNATVSGRHNNLTTSSRIDIDWKFSFSRTTADSPDRRDLTWNYDESNNVYYLRRESIANYRTFINMYENEGSGRVDIKLNLGSEADEFKKGNIIFGLQAKLKNRDFGARDFFYGTKYLPGTHDPENPNEYLTDQAIMDGELTIEEATALSGLLPRISIHLFGIPGVKL